VWLDESATIVLVKRGLGGLLSHLSESESSPPLYYVLAWFWTKVFGTGVIGFRSMSALIGTLTVPAMYGAGRQISARVGLWAAALATVNPAMYYYSQEARAYGLLVLFSAVALMFWLQAMREPTTRSLWSWAAFSALALLTHYFAVFMFLPELLLLWRRLGTRRLLGPVGLVVVVGAALLPLALDQQSSGKASWIEESSLPSRVAEAVKQFLIGLGAPLTVVAAVVCGLLSLAAILRLARHADQRERSAGVDVLIVAVAAVGLPAVISLSKVVDVFDGRNVIAAWTAFALLIALGLGTAARSRGANVLGAAICALFAALVVAVNVIPAYQRDDWRGVAGVVRSAGPQAIVVAPDQGLLPMSIYLPSLRIDRASSVSTSELEFVALRAKRSGRSPLAPVVPTTPPAGYRLASVTRHESYAVARFVSTAPVTLSRAELQHDGFGAETEVISRD
jgi:hypothetical protein